MSGSEELQTFFELSIDLLCIANTEGYFERVNPAFFCEVLGYDKQTLTSQPFATFVHPEDREETEAVMNQLDDGEILKNFINRYIAEDGSIRWLSWRAVPHRKNNRIYAVARDLTEQRKVEQMKNQVISVVNHELRTPLSSIKGALELGWQLHDEELSEEMREFLDIAYQSTRRLERIVDDILVMEKIEGKQEPLKMKELDPTHTIRELVKETAVMQNEKEIELETDVSTTGVQIEADPDRLHQVLHNLVSNALKFSPENSVVELSVQQKEEFLRISVRDQGPGIPDEFHDRIFDKFTRWDNSDSREKKGSGLGLSIAKTLTEKMGGEIGFETTQGEGTTFWVELPVVSQ